MNMRSSVRLALALAGVSATALASSTTAWEMNGYQDFIKGTFSGVALSRDGRMSLAPRLDTVFTSDQPAIWSAAATSDGTVYVGTGHRGRVYRIAKTGTGNLLWTAPEPEVFAVAVAPDGAVYAGTSPSGKVYRLRNGKAEAFYAPGAKYIWSLAVGPDGAVYVGTGDQGRIYRVTPNGQGEIYYESGQTHITALAFDREGRLLAGSEPNGVLYRVMAKGKAFVLYDANLPEIRTISTAPDGTLYVAALGGSVMQRANAAGTGAGAGASGSAVTAPTTTITVTDDTSATQQGGIDLKPKAQAGTQQAVTSTITPVQAPQQVEMMGVEKSAVYRINLDNTVETLWTSKDENAYDLLLSSGSLMLATDVQGRIYRLGLDRRLTLLAQTKEGETTRLLASQGSVLAATATMGKVLRLTDSSGATGTYEAPVHDAGSVAKWGQLTWRADKPAAAHLTFETRSGNSARPDNTWSDWSAPMSDPNGSAVTSPNARFIQWRAQFAGNGADSPVLTSASVAYLPQNNPPVMRSVTITTQLAPAGAAQRTQAAAPATTSVYSITVSDTGDATANAAAGTSTQVVSRGITQQIVINWTADDPDGDRLTYAVWFRGEEDNQWKLLRSNITDTTLTLEGDAFADGKYYFRVVGSDKLANPAGAARESELVSAPVLFDNTPPRVTVGTPRRNGSRLEVDVEASDAASPLRRAEYSIDAATWVPVEAADGITDGMAERFNIVVDNLSAGEHLIVVRVYDSANNAGLSRVLVR